MTITSTSTGQEHFAEWISAGAKAVAAQQVRGIEFVNSSLIREESPSVLIGFDSFY